jgi:hypothetical protein
VKLGEIAPRTVIGWRTREAEEHHRRAMLALTRGHSRYRVKPMSAPLRIDPKRGNTPAAGTA